MGRVLGWIVAREEILYQKMTQYAQLGYRQLQIYQPVINP